MERKCEKQPTGLILGLVNLSSVPEILQSVLLFPGPLRGLCFSSFSCVPYTAQVLSKTSTLGAKHFPAVTTQTLFNFLLSPSYFI